MKIPNFTNYDSILFYFYTYNTFRRYEMLWLPLVAANFKRSKELAAPLDIAWVWHVHMLAPESYAAVSDIIGDRNMRTVGTEESKPAF